MNINGFTVGSRKLLIVNYGPPPLDYISLQTKTQKSNWEGEKKKKKQQLQLSFSLNISAFSLK